MPRQRDSATDRSEIYWTYSDRHRILEKLSELMTAATTEIRMITTLVSFERILNHHVEKLTRKVRRIQ